MLNNTNVSNPILLTNVFTDDLLMIQSNISKNDFTLTNVLDCFLISEEQSSPAFYCTDVIYFSFSLRFIHYTFWCERAFTFAINRTYCIKNKQSSPAHI